MTGDAIRALMADRGGRLAINESSTCTLPDQYEPLFDPRLRSIALRPSSRASMAKAKGKANSQTSQPIGALPNNWLPQGV